MAKGGVQARRRPHPPAPSLSHPSPSPPPCRAPRPLLLTVTPSLSPNPAPAPQRAPAAPPDRRGRRRAPRPGPAQPRQQRAQGAPTVVLRCVLYGCCAVLCRGHPGEKGRCACPERASCGPSPRLLHPPSARPPVHAQGVRHRRRRPQRPGGDRLPLRRGHRHRRAAGTLRLAPRRCPAPAPEGCHFNPAGMAEEALGRIWGRFKQADEATSEQFGGTGLGLALVKEARAPAPRTRWAPARTRAHGRRCGSRQGFAAAERADEEGCCSTPPRPSLTPRASARIRPCPPARRSARRDRVRRVRPRRRDKIHSDPAPEAPPRRRGRGRPRLPPVERDRAAPPQEQRPRQRRRRGPQAAVLDGRRARLARPRRPPPQHQHPELSLHRRGGARGRPRAEGERRAVFSLSFSWPPVLVLDAPAAVALPLPAEWPRIPPDVCHAQNSGEFLDLYPSLARTLTGLHPACTHAQSQGSSLKGTHLPRHTTPILSPHLGGPNPARSPQAEEDLDADGSDRPTDSLRADLAVARRDLEHATDALARHPLLASLFPPCPGSSDEVLCLVEK